MYTHVLVMYVCMHIFVHERMVFLVSTYECIHINAFMLCDADLHAIVHINVCAVVLTRVVRIYVCAYLQIQHVCIYVRMYVSLTVHVREYERRNLN